MTTTTNKSLNEPAIGSSSWGGPLNDNFTYLDAALGSSTSLSLTSATLTVSQYRSLVLSVSGANSAAIVYTIPASIGGQWIVSNQTTGTGTITVIQSGIGVACTNGKHTLVYANGAGVYTADDWQSGGGGGGGSPGGSTNSIQYNTSGTFGGSANFTYDGTNVNQLGSTNAELKYTINNQLTGASVASSLYLTAGTVGSGIYGSLSTWNNSGTNSYMQLSGSSAVATINHGFTTHNFYALNLSTPYAQLGTAGLKLGSSLALNIYHDGSNAYYTTSTGDTTFSSPNASLIKFVSAPSGAQRGTLDPNGNFCAGNIPSQASSGIYSSIAAAGVFNRAGATGALGSTVYNIEFLGGSNCHLWVGNSDFGQISTTSDYRLKKDVTTTIIPALDRVNRLRPVNYAFKYDSIPREGFIAHEVQEVIPSAVSYNKDDIASDGKIQPQSLNIAPLVAVLTKAIQELSAEVSALRKELDAVKSKLP
jgi:hypothetical protein